MASFAPAMTEKELALVNAYRDFVINYDANVAVTLAYNGHISGTASHCIRRKSRYGPVEIINPRLKTEPGVNRLPQMLGVSASKMQKDAYLLQRAVDRELFGTRFNRLPKERRTSFIGCPEQLQNNPHMHLMWRVPTEHLEAFPEIVRRAWCRENRRRTVHVTTIKDDGWGHYITKSFHDITHADSERLIFSH